MDIPCLAHIKSAKTVMTKRISKINKILVAIEMMLLLIFIIIYYLALPIKVKKLVHIPHGSVSKIITHLRQNESISVGIVDKYLFRFFGQPQSGWIDLKTKVLSKGDLLYRLSHSKAAVKTVTLLPGETSYFFLKSLRETFDLNETLLHQHYKKRMPIAEGFIVPETYNIPIGLSEKELMHVLYLLSYKTHVRRAEKFLGVYHQKQWFKYLRMASVIQKEAANKEEMPLIASVIHNRIKKRMRLQMDGTLNYGLFSHQKVTPYRIRNDKSRFNTYKYKGLPHLPVCAVSTDAIEAALRPAKTDYLYFFKNKRGNHDFSRYYSTHLKNIANGKK